MRSYSSKVEIARTADTNAYLAGDVIGTSTSSGGAVHTFRSIGPSRGIIKINDADLRYDVAAVPGSMANFRLHLYSATPPSALADNAVWTLPAGDRPYYLGYVDIGTPAITGVSGSATLFVQTTGLGSKIVQLGPDAALYGYLVTDGAFTPTSAATLAVRLAAEGL